MTTKTGKETGKQSKDYEKTSGTTRQSWNRRKTHRWRSNA